MNQTILDDFLTTHEVLPHHKKYVDSIKKPSVDIFFSPEPAKNHESRFGGVPLVPAGFVWPQHPKGEYRFLGQINFSDIENAPDALPQQGLLPLFYAYSEEDDIFWGDDNYILSYYYPCLDGLVISTQAPTEYKAQKISLITGVEIPRYMELRNDWMFDTEILDELYYLDGCSEDYMLGYPSSNTLYYDPTPSDDWTSLLVLRSHDAFDWCWGDGNKLILFIEKEKLKNADFTQLNVETG